jgi:capsular polysaccharide biosynthesis protein
MELRRYWRIICRRLWIVILLLLIVLGASLTLRRPAPPLYQATMRMLVDVPPLPMEEGMAFDPRYYAALATEYLVDDFSGFVTSQVVAEDISARLAAQGMTVPPGALQGSMSSEKIHRLVTLRVTWGDPDQALAIAQAAVEALREESPKYFTRLQAGTPQISVIDKPSVVPVGPGLRARLDLPLRLGLALLTGLGLAFLLDYLDDSLRDAEDVRALGLAVVGEIPAHPRWRWLPWRRDRWL